MTEEKCACPGISMEEWIQQEDTHADDPRFCRPCRLGVVASWYVSELKEQGQKDLADALKSITSNEEDANLPLTICKEFDRIKGVVEEPLRERLKDFDCATQVFNPDDVTEDPAATASKSREEVTQDG